MASGLAGKVRRATESDEFDLSGYDQAQLDLSDWWVVPLPRIPVTFLDYSDIFRDPMDFNLKPSFPTGISGGTGPPRDWGWGEQKRPPWVFCPEKASINIFKAPRYYFCGWVLSELFSLSAAESKL